MMIPSRSRREAGNAMLELVLLLPMYTLVLFIVITMGEYGQVATQSHCASRYAVWQKLQPQADSLSLKFFGHFHGRMYSGPGAILQPVTFDKDASFDLATEKAITMTANSSVEFMGAHSWSDAATADRVTNAFPLMDPLYGATGSLRTITPIQTFNMGFDAAKLNINIEQITRIAMDGDTYQAGGADDVPWLRRHYTLVSVLYEPMARFLGQVEFQTHHTMIRPRIYRTNAHKPYPGSSIDAKTMDTTSRFTAARDNQFYKKVPISDRENNHQIDALRTRKLLLP